jgi:hypothetical protein
MLAVNFLLGALAATADALGFNISVTSDLLANDADGRVIIMLAPAGVDPLNDTDVVTSPNNFFGKNMYQFGGDDSHVFEGGSGHQPRTSVWGFPNISMEDVEPGDYTVQAFFNVYETVTRSDGSVVSVRFPCGDGAEPVSGPGSLVTEAVNVTIKGDERVDLSFAEIVETDDFNGTETGGCSQANYEDTELLRYVKIRSDVLSDFWARDMYIGANVLLPAGYDHESDTRYPVIYHQGHWPSDRVAFGYPNDPEFVEQWDSGFLPNTTDPAPKIIIVSFRHETPFYDDSYAVNTANIGPYGDAINDELIPHLESLFKTIQAPYGRIQDGGSTGGWESAANLIFRPDLFGACFSSYPDSLSFHRHQDIPLYESSNAYTRADGSKIYSIREVVNDTLTDVTTVEDENHWELSFGTSSRSALQWDVWNAVFGVQGLNGYPLEPWDKVTGEIYPDAVAYWRSMDLADHVVSNWETMNLGEVLEGRIFVYVGSWDNYFLNKGVMEFQRSVEAQGGSDWANVTILEQEEHGGNYLLLDTWGYLQLVVDWVDEHGPDGPSPLSAAQTSSSARGNKWADVIAQGGREAAVARQGTPTLAIVDGKLHGDVGRWDPGVTLTAQWLVDGEPCGGEVKAKQGEALQYTKWASSGTSVQLEVTGTKRGYIDETRISEEITL